MDEVYARRRALKEKRTDWLGRGPTGDAAELRAGRLRAYGLVFAKDDPWKGRTRELIGV